MRQAAAFCFLALAGCERAGADFQNAAKQPVEVTSTLLPSNAGGATNTFLLKPGGEMQSVWLVSEHRLLQFKYASGQVERFEGETLTQLATECPKHCILRATDSGVKVVGTNVFGHPKD
jgi:hypothetical protein